MRITVEGDPKEGVTTMAVFVYNLLSQWGIPCQLDVEGARPVWDGHLINHVRHVADRLEHSISVTDSKQPPAFRWTDYLIEDPEDGHIVKGTMVKVGEVISLMVDGYSRKAILTTHPELCENDIRACLMFMAETEGFRECSEEDSREWEQDPGTSLGTNYSNLGHATGTTYSRRAGVPTPVRAD